MMAIDLGNYNDVASRIIEFREKYPDGRLRPVNPRKPYTIETIDGKTFVVYCAAAYRDPADKLPGIGVAWEPFPGPSNFTKDSELQNAETSAWGRAIVAALIADTKKGVASAEEVRNRAEANGGVAPGERPATDKQRRELERMVNQEDAAVPPVWPLPEDLTMRQAAMWLDEMKRHAKPLRAERRGPTSGAGEPAPARGDDNDPSPSLPPGDPPVVAASPAPVSTVLADADTREGSDRDGNGASPALELGDTSASTDYEMWERLDLVAECAERQIDVRANASVKTMAELLHGWDRTYLTPAES